MKAILIAAATSGCGKTTFTMGLLRTLRERGLRVQPFKCGPDYIDPIYHRMASGRESVNLDTFMSSPDHVRELFHRYGADADICVIEGAMGLFDGADGPRGSAAEVAQLLDVPVLLLVSAKSVAYSVAPLIYGFRHFNPNVRISGVVFNFVASERQYATLQRACADAGIPCLGYLHRNPELTIPSRHLGLTIKEEEEVERLIQRAAESVADLELDIAPYTPSALPVHKESSVSSRTGRAEGESRESESLLVARDAAFNFTYRANLDALRQLGKVTFFSPLRDSVLPPCDILYLPGGYPELFAEQLAANTLLRSSIRDFAESGGCILAECGGFMYLCQDIDGTPMCGVLPLSATMQNARLHLGYRQMTLDGQLIRGHEFHYSSIRDLAQPSTPQLPTASLSTASPFTDPSSSITRLCNQETATGDPVPTPLYRYKNVVAGYTHWYWADNPLTTLSLLLNL